MNEFNIETIQETNVKVTHKACGQMAQGIGIPPREASDERMVVVICTKCKASELISEVDYQQMVKKLLNVKGA